MSTSRSRVATFGYRSLLAGALIIASAAEAAGQTGGITGAVTDRASGLPVAAARIQVVGNQTAVAATDERGRYLLRNLPPGAVTLRVTRIGYRPTTQAATIPTTDTITVNIQLSQSAVELQQVVVTGTGGATERVKIGASIGSVDVENLRDQMPTLNFSQVLAAKVTGVRSVGVGGGVGGGQDLRIRGISSFSLNQRPAIYIDGVRVDTRGTEWAIGTIACCSFTGGNSTDRLSDINPNDIERVEVLKGAAASTLYGSEATNGVIQIFTKRGRGEGRTQWSLGLGTGFNRLRENLPTKQFPRFKGPGPDSVRALDANGLIENGLYTGLDISASGGTQRSTYFASGLLSQEEGSIKPNDQLKGNLRLNVNFVPTDRTTIELRSAYTRNHVNELQAGNNWTALLGNAMNGNPRTATKIRPYGEAWVPVSDIQKMTTESDADRWTGGLTLSYAVTPAFTHRVTAGLDAVSDQKSRFFPYSGLYGPAGVTFGQRNLGTRQYRTYTVDYLGQLNLNLPMDIESNTSFGVQGFWEQERLHMATGNTFPGPGVSTVSSGATTNGAEGFVETINMGFLAQNRFGWKDRLFATVGARIDGNSAFGQDFGYQTYPKFDASYDLSKHEGFLPSLITAARLRGGVGKAGKFPGAFDSFTSFGAAPVFDATAGIIPLNPGNANLRPEITTEREVGFELGLWDDRVGIEATRYWTATKDAIVGQPNPPSMGFSQSRRVNLGEIENRGWEASVNFLAISRPNFEWTTSVRADGNENEVTDLGGLTLACCAFRIGYPAQGVWGRKATGYSVVNGRPVTTRSDTAVFFGAPLPTSNFSFDNTIRWRGFQLYGMLTMERGAFFSNGDRAYRIRQGGADEILELLGPNGEATFASDSLFQHASILDFFDKRDNVRLRELSLTYQVPEGWSGKLGLGRSSIQFSGQNLNWWDDCHCVDPNMNWAGASAFGIGSGFLAQPSPRQFRFHIRTQF
ncbi:MAG: TonB-dependent receptor domain-containing protein [Gemmatimonadota bacterium]